MVHLSLRCYVFQIATDEKSGVIRIGKHQNSPRLRQAADEGGLFLVFENAKPCSLQHYGIKDLFDLILVVTAFHNNDRFNGDHDTRSFSAAMRSSNSSSTRASSGVLLFSSLSA